MNDVELRLQLEREHADSFGWAVTCCRGSRDAAEDVMQTAYLTILDGSARFDGRSSFRTWLFGVIRMTAMSHRRTSWLRELLLERKAERVVIQPPASADADAERDSRDARLRATLAELSARQREVLVLVFYHELTVEEAAVVMGIAVGSARTHYARGKERMAALLGRGDEL